MNMKFTSESFTSNLTAGPKLLTLQPKIRDEVQAYRDFTCIGQGDLLETDQGSHTQIQKSKLPKPCNCRYELIAKTCSRDVKDKAAIPESVSSIQHESPPPSSCKIL